MKNIAFIFLTILFIKSGLSVASEIPVTSHYNIIKSVISKHNSKCVNFLYSTKYQGESMNLVSVGATEEYQHKHPNLDHRLFKDAVSNSEVKELGLHKGVSSLTGRFLWCDLLNRRSDNVTRVVPYRKA
jgi:hypothetical protein